MYFHIHLWLNVIYPLLYRKLSKNSTSTSFKCSRSTECTLRQFLWLWGKARGRKWEEICSRRSGATLCWHMWIYFVFLRKRNCLFFFRKSVFLLFSYPHGHFKCFKRTNFLDYAKISFRLVCFSYCPRIRFSYAA